MTSTEGSAGTGPAIIGSSVYFGNWVNGLIDMPDTVCSIAACLSCIFPFSVTRDTLASQ